ncbi:MAG: hypothetical protein ACRDCH_00075 [Metamycoplasmataceae bacterium]
MKKIIKGMTNIKLNWKDYDVIVEQEEFDTGDIFGTFKGKLKIMNNSKKTTINDLAKIMNNGFETINKRLDLMDKKIEVMNKKIDLILATPTMQREINHKTLSKLN